MKSWTCVVCQKPNALAAPKCRYCLRSHHGITRLGDLIEHWLMEYDRHRATMRRLRVAKRERKTE